MLGDLALTQPKQIQSLKNLKDADSRRAIQEGFLDSVHLFQQLWTSMAFYEGLVEKPKAMAMVA